MRWIMPAVVLTAIVGTMTASYAAEDVGRSAGARPEPVSFDRILKKGDNVRLLITSDESDRAAEYWTPERMEKAQPMPLPDVSK
jgi:hypothetical protein